MKRSQKQSLSYNPVTIEQAWFNLASSILIYGIEDARNNPDPRKRKWAKEWLLTEDARFLFESVMSNTEMIDLRKWVNDGCPALGNKNK